MREEKKRTTTPPNSFCVRECVCIYIRVRQPISGN